MFFHYNLQWQAKPFMCKPLCSFGIIKNILELNNEDQMLQTGSYEFI